jgi:thiol-disulfide isomerase/thioredoxin
MKRIAIAAGVLALAAALVIGLSQAGGGDDGGSGGDGAPQGQAEVESRLAGAPAPLASLHKQANELLGGGEEAYTERLKELRGYPVVVNKWASWCAPCRAEFPHFQRLSASLGKRVAFIGVDSNDNYGDAAKFLEDYPVSYPSYKDGDNRIAQAFNGSIAFPATAFYDAKGKLQYTRQGEYKTQAELRRDIRRYAGG